MIAYIYQIINQVNNKKYIGQTTNLFDKYNVVIAENKLF